MKHELTRSNDYDFFEEAMRDFFPAFYAPRHAQRYMRTDIKETDDAYLMEVEMPGLDKKDIRLELKDGYLNITANKSEKDEAKRTEMVQQVEQILAEDVPAYYIQTPITLYVTSSAVEGFEIYPIDIYEMKDVSFAS